MLGWKKTARMLNEENTKLVVRVRELEKETERKTYENAQLSGLLNGVLDELEKVKAECRSLATQLGAALKELEFKRSGDAERAEGPDRDEQWENMMRYTGEKQEGFE